jgi:hypothetical protein
MHPRIVMQQLKKRDRCRFQISILSACMGRTLAGASEGQQFPLSRDCAILNKNSRNSL